MYACQAADRLYVTRSKAIIYHEADLAIQLPRAKEERRIGKIADDFFVRSEIPARPACGAT
jgi:hypothetical protein